MRGRLGGVDLLVYVRALVLLARNPAIIVVPLLIAIVAVLLGMIGGGTQADGFFGGLTGGITNFIVTLLRGFGLGVALIIADDAWRHGRASFDDGWTEGRRKGGDILVATLIVTFIFSIASYAGSIFGPLTFVLFAVGAYFMIYAIPAAAIGGIPGSAAIQVSIDRARANPLPTLLVTVVSVVVYGYLGLFAGPLIGALVAPYATASLSFVAALIDALVGSVGIGYIALILAKTYADISLHSRRW